MACLGFLDSPTRRVHFEGAFREGGAIMEVWVGGVIGVVVVGSALYPSIVVNPKVNVPFGVSSGPISMPPSKTAKLSRMWGTSTQVQRSWASSNQGHPAGSGVVPDDAVASVQIRGGCMPSGATAAQHKVPRPILP